MTIFLTYSVYALRLSSDLPTQSTFVPMISWYFIVCSAQSLCSIIWFYFANLMITKNKIPKIMDLFAIFLQNTLRCSFKYKKLKKTKKIDVLQAVEETKNTNTAKLEAISNKVDLETQEKLTKCDAAENLNKEKKEFESKIAYLNAFMSFLFASALLIFTLSIRYLT